MIDENKEVKKQQRISIKWTQEEDNMLQLLVSHHGEDYEKIAQELNFTFQVDKFLKWSCKLRWQYKFYPTSNKEELTNDEIKLLYPLYINAVLHGVEKYWVFIVQKFTQRSKNFLRRSMMKYFLNTLKKLIYMYADEKQHNFYLLRIGQMSQLTINLLIYYACYQAQDFEMKDGIFNKIIDSSKSIYSWIHYLFNMGLFDNDDLTAYLERDILNQMPTFTPESIVESITPILLLDTLNRVCFNFKPYQLYETQPEDIKIKRKMINKQKRLKKEKASRQRQFNKFLSLSRRSTQSKVAPQLFIGEELFEPLTQEEISIIQNSQTAKLLLPAQSILHKRHT